MFIIMFRTRAVNAILQLSHVPTNGWPTTRESAESEANRLARLTPSVDYFVFEAQSQHSARIEVDVKKP
jgi:hypothetical protein